MSWAQVADVVLAGLILAGIVATVRLSTIVAALAQAIEDNGRSLDKLGERLARLETQAMRGLA